VNWLRVRNKVSETHSQRLRERAQRLDTDIHLAALDLPDMRPVQS